jgi:hypothetical protein
MWQVERRKTVPFGCSTSFFVFRMLQLALLKAKKKNDERLQKRLFSDEKSIAV